MDSMTTNLWLIVCGATLIAGFVKGTVGFAMPTILISLLGSFVAPDLALAGLILPTLITNVWQALRGGFGAALVSARVHWRYIGMVMAFILFSAQLVTLLPVSTLYLLLGVPVTLFSVAQLAGWSLVILPHQRRGAELGIGAFAGFIGGMSGVWGPPTVMYLTALGTDKLEHMRVQGVVYALGAVMLTAAHVKSGVLTAATLPFSALLVVPALLGMVIGFSVQDRLDQVRFRQATLAVLVLAGLNLVRRGLTG